MKNVILILFVFCLLISCNKDEENTIEIIPILISKSELYGNGEEEINQSNLVITDSVNWVELIMKMDSVNNTSNSFTEIDVDFSQFQIIAIFDEIRPNSGSSIEILSIKEDESNITVSIGFISSNGDIPVINQPFHIVKIKKTEKPVVFIDS
ncbi:MAG: hypothetical protein L3J09_12850 [Flavobacteriaceae bacterium]|nr:hypothetical protein [Flavobacteriaceae bacterium]